MFRPDWKGLMIYEMVEVDMLSGRILFNDPRIDFVFTKQGVVWLHTSNTFYHDER